MKRKIEQHLVGGMVVVGGVFAAVALAQVGGGTGCYVCGEKNCTGPCEVGVQIDICDSPTRQAEDGEAGLSGITWPPSTMVCTSFKATTAAQIIDGPCDFPPPGNQWTQGPCGAGTNCCFVHSDALLGSFGIGSTPRCNGYPCSGTGGVE